MKKEKKVLTPEERRQIHKQIGRHYRSLGNDDLAGEEYDNARNAWQERTYSKINGIKDRLKHATLEEKPGLFSELGSLQLQVGAYWRAGRNFKKAGDYKGLAIRDEREENFLSAGDNYMKAAEQLSPVPSNYSRRKWLYEEAIKAYQQGEGDYKSEEINAQRKLNHLKRDSRNLESKASPKIASVFLLIGFILLLTLISVNITGYSIYNISKNSINYFGIIIIFLFIALGLILLNYKIR